MNLLSQGLTFTENRENWYIKNGEMEEFVINICMKIHKNTVFCHFWPSSIKKYPKNPKVSPWAYLNCMKIEKNSENLEIS